MEYLYEALQNGDPITVYQLAIWTNTNEQEVSEWLAQQVRRGVLDIEDPAVEVNNRRFCLRPEQPAPVSGR